MRTTWVLIILSLSSISFAADVQMQAEIEHLLDYMSKSGCIFIRNGKPYSPQEAVSHVKEKYAYFKDRIDSTEKFIELSASKSILSNRPYQIKCGESEKMDSQKWLLEELAKYRNGKASTAPAKKRGEKSRFSQ